MQRWGLRYWIWGAQVLLALALVACASPARVAPSEFGDAKHWAGRLSVSVRGQSPQSMTADFELDGDPTQGRLQLSTPLGSKVADLLWSPTRAVLQANGTATQYASLVEMVHSVSGTDLPIAQLFDWLNGVPTPAPGWAANLSQIANGRISAKRDIANADEAELKVILTP